MTFGNFFFGKTTIRQNCISAKRRFDEMTFRENDVAPVHSRVFLRFFSIIFVLLISFLIFVLLVKNIRNIIFLILNPNYHLFFVWKLFLCDFLIFSYFKWWNLKFKIFKFHHFQIYINLPFYKFKMLNPKWRTRNLKFGPTLQVSKIEKIWRQIGFGSP